MDPTNNVKDFGCYLHGREDIKIDSKNAYQEHLNKFDDGKEKFPCFDAKCKKHLQNLLIQKYIILILIKGLK